MGADPVTVAIPVLNGADYLPETLAAVRRQRLDRPVELLVADSGSRDDSRAIARSFGAEVIDVPLGGFAHGRTRNLLAERASGAHVAFLTQDAVPADDLWLSRLLHGFTLTARVALVFGPYRPRPGASHMVRRELESWFASFAPDGRPRVDPDGAEEGLGLGRRRFFTDANGCLLREAWAEVRFRDVPYAEDHLLARDMLAAGYRKVFEPAAAVVHSHDYPPLALFRRSFDEWRALREVHGLVAPASPVRHAVAVQREVRDDVSYLRRDGTTALGLAKGTAASLRHHTVRAAGAALGSRADKLPAPARRACSLERRETFEPVERRPAIGRAA